MASMIATSPWKHYTHVNMQAVQHLCFPGRSFPAHAPVWDLVWNSHKLNVTSSSAWRVLATSDTNKWLNIPWTHKHIQFTERRPLSHQVMSRRNERWKCLQAKLLQTSAVIYSSGGFNWMRFTVATGHLYRLRLISRVCTVENICISIVWDQQTDKAADFKFMLFVYSAHVILQLTKITYKCCANIRWCHYHVLISPNSAALHSVLADCT